MKLPAIWRKRRKGGKEYGNRYATVRGDDINLGTADLEEARETLRGILMQHAAEASEPDIEDGAADETASAGEGAPGQTPTPAAAPSPQPAPSSPEPPPPAAANDNDRLEAEATNAAAQEGAAAQGSPDPAAELLGQLPPDAIEGLLLQGGQAMVLGQLQLQGWIIKKRFGRLVQPLEGPLAQKTIDAASQAWVAQLTIWFPDIKACPPWLIAVVAPFMLLPEQLRTSIRDPAAKREEEAAPAAQAAA